MPQSFFSMYSKEEAAKIKREFWIAFDHYSRKFLGHSRKWIRYNTKIKDLSLKFEADRTCATVMLAIENNNEDIRFDRFVFIKKYETVFEEFIDNTWIWDEEYVLENEKKICALYKQLNGVNIYRKSDWTTIFEFLASNMILLEKAFDEIKPLLEEYIKNNLNQ